LRIYILSGDVFADRVIGNLVNSINFCRVCGPTCSECRMLYGSHAADIVGVKEFDQSLPNYIENPDDLLPSDPPKCDLVLAIGLHVDILSAIPNWIAKTGADALIVPIENPRWCPLGLKRQVEKDLQEIGVGSAFPKPFCSLEKAGNKSIDLFIDKYKVGLPRLRIETWRGKISNAQPLSSAPCGCTWFVSQRIRWCSTTDIPTLERVVADAHHNYPCTASMDVDSELKEPILHKAGYIIREAVKEAVNSATEVLNA
jgi:hypothetical protein